MPLSIQILRPTRVRKGRENRCRRLKRIHPIAPYKDSEESYVFVGRQRIALHPLIAWTGSPALRTHSNCKQPNASESWDKQSLHNVPPIAEKHVENFGRIVERNWPSITGKITGHEQLPCCLKRTAALLCSCHHDLLIGLVQQQWCTILFDNCFRHDVAPACNL